VSQLLRDWADASLQCWRQRKGNEGNNVSATRAKASAQQGQSCQHNASDNANAMLAMMPALAMIPAQCRQRRQRCIGWTIKGQVTMEQRWVQQ
jgi:hypothetical protein